jgi:hypothetical protein
MAIKKKSTKKKSNSLRKAAKKAVPAAKKAAKKVVPAAKKAAKRARAIGQTMERVGVALEHGADIVEEITSSRKKTSKRKPAR